MLFATPHIFWVVSIERFSVLPWFPVYWLSIEIINSSITGVSALILIKKIAL